MEIEFMLPVRSFVFTATLVALVVSLQVQSAHAAFGITSVAGVLELPGGPPPSVHPGGNEGGLPIIFPEVLNATVIPTQLHPLGLGVDHDGSNVVAAPTISGNVVNPALVSSTLPVGTGFNSYLIHFDPAGSPFFAFYVATINFDNPIIGVQLFSDGFALQKPTFIPYIGTLEQGDVQVSFPNNGSSVPLAYYPGSLDFRGVEEDAFVLSISGNTVILAGSTSGPEIDQVRILTAPTIREGLPEPAAATTWALIAICCGAIGRRRSKNGG
jgi:hypothetical protein